MPDGKLNILQFTSTSYPGGSETVLAYIAKNLDPQRFNSLVCVIDEGWLTEYLGKLDVRYLIVENKRTVDLAFLANIVRLIKNEKIDLIHAHEFETNFYGSLAARVAGIPMIGTIHGKGYFTEKKYRRLAYKVAIALSRRTIAVSEDLRQYLASELKLKNNHKLLTIYNGIDINKYSNCNPDPLLKTKLGIGIKTLVAGTFGSLYEVKGIPVLLRAVKKVIKEVPDFKLIIAGTGDKDDELKMEAKTLGIMDAVMFLGLRDDIPQLLNITDLYVCSSFSEGLSLSIMEAMATNKPIVATDVGGNPELITHGLNGLLVPPRNPVALAESIISLLKDNNIRMSMGKKGREIIENNFSLFNMIKNYQDLYNKLVSE